jgi:uncharacterized membrane-anchored protein YitT (DUF2179 family)
MSYLPISVLALPLALFSFWRAPLSFREHVLKPGRSFPMTPLMILAVAIVLGILVLFGLGFGILLCCAIESHLTFRGTPIAGTWVSEYFRWLLVSTLLYMYWASSITLHCRAVKSGFIFGLRPIQ